MKKAKRIKTPDDFGKNIWTQITNASLDEFINFIPTFYKEVGAKSLLVQDCKSHFDTDILNKVTDPDLIKHLKGYEDEIVDAYYQMFVALGFAIGQRCEVEDQAALKEIDYVWQKLREKKVFGLYPREKSAA